MNNGYGPNKLGHMVNFLKHTEKGEAQQPPRSPSPLGEAAASPKKMKTIVSHKADLEKPPTDNMPILKKQVSLKK